jgi:DNA-directed RNA polymerase specialized sigma24 family protein
VAARYTSGPYRGSWSFGQSGIPAIRYRSHVQLEAIIRGAAKGERRAWDSLSSYLTPRLERFFATRYGRFGSDDLTQDLLIVIWQQLPNFEFRSEAEFKSWVFTIAKYVGLAALRQWNHQKKLARALGQERTPSTRFTSRFARAERLEQVLREVDKLSESYRRVVENTLDGGDARDLAKQDGIEWVSARVRESRTWALLRRRVRPSTPPP